MSTGTINTLEGYFNNDDSRSMVLFYSLEERRDSCDDLLNRLNESMSEWIRLAVAERNVPAAPDTIAARTSNRRRSVSQRKIIKYSI